MTTMTIHADEVFSAALRAYAADLGKSVNQTIKDVFVPILGLAAEKDDRVNPWKRFAGVLPQIDCAKWDAEIESSRTVDAELWK